MYNRLFDFINTNRLLYKYQFGFQEGKSTCMALITLIDKISAALDNSEIVVGLFLDFSKAFDTVDHKILLNKLFHYGIQDIPLKWLKSYLSQRYQYVTYNNHKSTNKLIQCGVLRVRFWVLCYFYFTLMTSRPCQSLAWISCLQMIQTCLLLVMIFMLCVLN